MAKRGNKWLRKRIGTTVTAEGHGPYKPTAASLFLLHIIFLNQSLEEGPGRRAATRLSISMMHHRRSLNQAPLTISGSKWKNMGRIIRTRVLAKQPRRSARLTNNLLLGGLAGPLWLSQSR